MPYLIYTHCLFNGIPESVSKLKLNTELQFGRLKSALRSLDRELSISLNMPRVLFAIYRIAMLYYF